MAPSIWGNDSAARRLLWDALLELEQLVVCRSRLIDGVVYTDIAEPGTIEQSRRRQELCITIQHLAKSHPKAFSKQCASKVTPVTEGRYALALLCRFGATSEAIAAACAAFPRAVRIPDHLDGLLPLHWACIRQLSPEIVMFLHQMYPKAALIRGDPRLSLLTPLFICCYSSPCKNRLANARYLLRVCPESALLRNARDDLPLHFALGRYGRDQDVILELLRAHPSTACQKSSGDCFGYPKLPIQLALEEPTQGTRWRTIIRQLLEAYPQAAERWDLVVASWKGIHPAAVGVEVAAHFFARRHGTPLNYSRTYPLHAMLDHEIEGFRFAEASSCLSQVVVQRTGKNLWKKMDDRGRLPLHLALGCPYTWYSEMVAFIEDLFSTEPRAAMIREPMSGLYPFMMVASALDVVTEANEHRILDWVYRMFRLDAGNFALFALQTR